MPPQRDEPARPERDPNPSSTDPPTAPGGSLAELGRGGASDQLDFRLVVQVLLRCLRLLVPVRRHLIRVGVIFAVAAAAGLPFLLLVPDVFWTRILQGEPPTALEARLLWLPDAALVPYDEAARKLVRDRWLIGVGVLSVVAVAIFGPLLYYAFWILQELNQGLRLRLLERLQALSLRFHAQSRVGDAIYRVYQDSAQITAVIETALLRPTWFSTSLLFSAIFGLFLSPVFALALIGLILPTLLLGRLFSPRLRKRFRRAREANSALTAGIQETLSAIPVIKAYQAEARELVRFEAGSLGAFARARHAREMVAWFGVLAFFGAGSTLVAMQAYLAWLARSETPLFIEGFGFTIVTLGIFTAAVSRLGAGTNALEALLRYWGRTQDVAIGLDRAFELLDLEPEVVDRPNAKPLREVRKSLVLDDVWFGYAPGQPVLRGVDLEIRPGELTAIVGPTGAGKSTLLTLVLRLYDPDRGAIEIDGQDLRDLQRESLRRNVGIALQEQILFSATARENIRYAVPRATDADVVRAARLACAHEFIERLPDGYDTRLGERGAKLSTGQRQRISIARALIRDTPILLLDEPTAALDAETEHRLLDNLADWGRERAILWITHRLTTVARADSIAVLESGCIVEHGSHAELMARPDAAYRRLLELDAGLPHPTSAELLEAGA